jgi:hypothetical protein
VVGASELDYSEDRSLVRVVDVSNGRVAAELNLRRGGQADLPRGVQAGPGPGSWVADTIIVESRVGPASALLVLRYRDGKLSFEDALRLNREVADATGLREPLVLNFGQPVFVDPVAREFMVELTLLQTGARGTSLWLTCERIARSCRKGRAIEPPTRWAARVHNPSRPLRD